MHTFKVWRTRPGDSLQLRAVCTCRHEVIARTYDDLATLIGEHRTDVEALRNHLQPAEEAS